MNKPTPLSKLRNYLLILLLLCTTLLTGCTPSDSTEETAAPSANLEIHFIDVGQADSTLLTVQGKAVLIDTGNRDDDETVIDYLHAQDVQQLDALIFTHPHEDHAGSGAAVAEEFQPETVYMNQDTTDSQFFLDLLDELDAQGMKPEHPSPGDTFSMGDCEFKFLGPAKDYQDTNDNSLIVRVTYGKNHFLFTGDAEQRPEDDLAESRYDLSADVLQAGHHGSETSSTYEFLREVNPSHVVISCGRDNSYGHPDQAALSRFRDVGATVYRTDTMGSVIAVSDGSEITFNQVGIESDREHQSDANGLHDLPTTSYIGNKNSKKFHLPDCSSLPSESNRIYFEDRQDALDEGYSPCKNCNP